MERNGLVARRLAAAGTLAAIGLLAVAPDLSGAQLGGLLRRKIAEATKTEEPAKPEEAAPASSTPAANDPDVVEVSDASLAALENSLRTEIRLREEFRKELAGKKTPEEYEACTQEVALSPELQAIVLQVAEATTPEQMQTLAAQAGKEHESLVLKRCGEDVRQYNESWRAKRLQEIQQQAAAAGGSPR